MKKFVRNLLFVLGVFILYSCSEMPEIKWCNESEYSKLPADIIINQDKFELSTGLYIRVWLLHVKGGLEFEKGLRYSGVITDTDGTIYTARGEGRTGEVLNPFRFTTAGKPPWWKVKVGYNLYVKLVRTSPTCEEIYVFISPDKKDVYISHSKSITYY